MNVFMCNASGGKEAYPTEKHAEAAARRASADFQSPMWTYKCLGCRGWHLTSRPPRPTARDPRRNAVERQR
jgi:hypothetical protein